MPGSVDLLLEQICRVVLHGRRFGPSESPSAFKTQFGCVLTSSVGRDKSRKGCYFALNRGDPRDNDELLKRFCEIENPYMQDPKLSINERKVIERLKENHRRVTKGRFIVPLPLKPDVTPLGESRARAVGQFKNLEQLLHTKGKV